MKTKLSLPPEANGIRLDKALAQFSEIGSRSRVEALIDGGRVTINGKLVKSSYPIRPGDLIEIEMPPKEEISLRPYHAPIDLLYEDSDILVVNKPSGLVVHPAAGHEGDTLVNILIGQSRDLSMKFGEQRPGIVHRLDKDTSGILVVAKNDFSHEALASQFKERSTHRVYHAVCFGTPLRSQFTVQSFLARHPTDRKRMASLRDDSKRIITNPNFKTEIGKWAQTAVFVEKMNPSGASYLRLKLMTGRTHQIRVHLSELGHALVADPIYSQSKDLHKLKSLEMKTKIQGFPHLALHAAELGFQHPRSKEELIFKAPWPNEMLLHLRNLGFLE